MVPGADRRGGRGWGVQGRAPAAWDPEKSRTRNFARATLRCLARVRFLGSSGSKSILIFSMIHKNHDSFSIFETTSWRRRGASLSSVYLFGSAPPGSRASGSAEPAASAGEGTGARGEPGGPWAHTDPGGTQGLEGRRARPPPRGTETPGDHWDANGAGRTPGEPDGVSGSLGQLGQPDPRQPDPRAPSAASRPWVLRGGAGRAARVPGWGSPWSRRGSPGCERRHRRHSSWPGRAAPRVRLSLRAPPALGKCPGRPAGPRRVPPAVETGCAPGCGAEGRASASGPSSRRIPGRADTLGCGRRASLKTRTLEGAAARHVRGPRRPLGRVLTPGRSVRAALPGAGRVRAAEPGPAVGPRAPGPGVPALGRAHVQTWFQ